MNKEQLEQFLARIPWERPSEKAHQTQLRRALLAAAKQRHASSWKNHWSFSHLFLPIGSLVALCLVVFSALFVRRFMYTHFTATTSVGPSTQLTTGTPFEVMTEEQLRFATRELWQRIEHYRKLSTHAADLTYQGKRVFQSVVLFDSTGNTIGTAQEMILDTWIFTTREDGTEVIVTLGYDEHGVAQHAHIAQKE